MAKYDFFSNQKMSFLGSYISHKVGRKILHLILNNLIKINHVLEIGPGRGFFAKYFCSHQIPYICYEPNRKLGEDLTALGAMVRQDYVPPIHESGASFDLIIISHVLEHMESPNVAYGLIAEASRVLKKGGLLVVFSPNAKNWGIDFYDIDATHSYVTTPSRIICMMTDNGFKPIKAMDLYGNFGIFPGIIIDKSISMFLGLASTLFPKSRRFVKGKSTFHANSLVIGKKESLLDK
jgi:SAM-dependent methyltransferase